MNDFTVGILFGVVTTLIFGSLAFCPLIIAYSEFNTSPVQLQKQICLQVDNFNKNDFILCPGECERNKDLELCLKPEKEQTNAERD